jgi:hypothetical protein
MRKIVVALLALTVVLSAIGVSARPAQADLSQLLPDGRFVVVADMQRVTRSSFWSTLAAENKLKKGLEEMQSTLGEIGIRLEDLSAIALVGSSPTLDAVVAVSGSFNPSAIVSNLRANPKVKLSSERYRNFEVFEVTNVAPSAKSHRVSFVFYDSSTAILGTLNGVRSAIDVRSGERPSLAQNAKLSAALAQNPAAAVRFAMDTPAEVGSRLKSDSLPLPDFASIRMIFGTIDFNTAMELNATLRSEAAAPAKAIADQLNGLIGMAKGFLSASGDPKTASIGEMLKTVTITSEETDVKISGHFPAEVLAQILR